MRGLVGVAALLSLTLLVACPAPGEGPKAERGYRRAAPVIAALARFRGETGAYPESLAQLAPRWIAAGALEPPVQPAWPFEYQRTYDGYLLTFRYSGPGMNDCTYAQPPGKWRCGGRF
jgi:hypothetical protein